MSLRVLEINSQKLNILPESNRIENCFFLCILNLICKEQIWVYILYFSLLLSYCGI